MLTEINQTEKEKYCMISLIHNELVNIPKKKQTHREQTSGSQWGMVVRKGNTGKGSGR